VFQLLQLRGMSPNVTRKYASSVELPARKGRSIEVNKLVELSGNKTCIIPHLQAGFSDSLRE